MKERIKKRICLTALLCGVVMLAAVLWAGEALPPWSKGLLCGLGGAAIGVGGSGVVMDGIARCLRPEDRAEL